jgi:hypothetical protein
LKCKCGKFLPTKTALCVTVQNNCRKEILIPRPLVLIN